MNAVPRRLAPALSTLVPLLLLPGTLLHAAEPAPAAPKSGLRLYVATVGNDAWSGTRPEPNARKTDGPFATLERARDEIRRLKKQGGLAPGGAVVEIRGGLVERAATFELGAEDSGTPDAPIEYRARPGEEVRLLGGRVVADWKPVNDPAVVARLDPAARAKVLRADLKALGVTDYGQVKGGGLELFFQDRPMPLARGPNQGVIHIVELLGGDQVKHRDGTTIDRIGKFTYEGDRPNRWVGEPELWLHGYWYRDWAEDYQKVASLDAQKRIITLAPPYHRYGFRKGQWFYGVNILAELDLPGCVGVYLDDMYSGTTIASNVFYRVTRAAFIGGGRDNTVEGNVFVECRNAMHMDARAMGWAKASVPGNLKTRLEEMPYKSPLWVKRYPRLPNTWNDEPAAPKGNVIAGNLFLRCKPWDDVFREARPYVDLSANLATDDDPGFVDAAKMDFQLKDDSPVYKRLPGLEKIPFGQIGLVIDEDRKSLPAR